MKWSWSNAHPLHFKSLIIYESCQNLAQFCWTLVAWASWLAGSALDWGAALAGWPTVCLAGVGIYPLMLAHALAEFSTGIQTIYPSVILHGIFSTIDINVYVPFDSNLYFRKRRLNQAYRG